MVDSIWRAGKRLAVLVPGIIVAYLSVRTIFPYFDQRVPLSIAIFLTYIVGAYLLVPGILRLWRFVLPVHHLPLYCTTPDGYASDPLNIGLIGSRKQLIRVMRATGWHVAKPVGFRSIALTILTTLLRRPYHGAPMSKLYLFGRSQDIGFEKQLVEHGRGHRQHVRFWATTYESIEGLSQKSIYWHNRKEELIARKLLWVGAASRDIGITFTRHSLQLTHAVANDTDQERELILEELVNADLAARITTIRLFRSYRLANFAWARSLQSDGKMTIARLKKLSELGTFTTTESTVALSQPQSA